MFVSPTPQQRTFVTTEVVQTPRDDVLGGRRTKNEGLLRNRGRVGSKGGRGTVFSGKNEIPGLDPREQTLVS